MRPVEYAPTLLLSGLIKCFWSTQRSFHHPQDTFQIIPDTYLEIIFSSGATCFLVTQTEHIPMPSCYLVNLLDKPFTIRAEGTLSLIGVRLYAWSLQTLFQDEQPMLQVPIIPLPKRLTGLEPDVFHFSKQLTRENYPAVASSLEVYHVF